MHNWGCQCAPGIFAPCGRIETGINSPSHCRSTPELDRLRAHLSALMTYRVSADLLEHMFPVDAVSCCRLNGSASISVQGAKLTTGVSRNWWDHAAILTVTSGRPMGSNR